jgi:hypothetical protein
MPSLNPATSSIPPIAYDRNRPEAVTHEYYDERPENAGTGH